MKIAIVNCQLGGGGAERVMANLANFFVGAGHSVAFFLTSDFYKGYEFPMKPEIAVDRFVGQKAKGPFGKIRLLTKHIKDYQPDVIVGLNQMSSFYASVVGRRIHVNVVTSERNSPKDYPTSKIERLLRSYAYFHSTKIVFQTAGARDYFSRRIQNKGVIIPNPLNPSFCPFGRELGSVNRKQIVMIGRLDSQKNQVVAIKAFQKLSLFHPECCLDIYGWALDKEYDSIIQGVMAANKNANIHFLGPTENVSEILSNAGVYLMTSDYEGMPNSLLEALASGVPCVSTDCRPGGAKDLIQNSKGAFLAHIGDAEGIEQSLTTIIDNYDYYFEQAKEYGAVVCKEYDIDRIGGMWLKLFGELR
jgi:GalNAc-alpha-(1->4)-GalNAc-alpha-(1->3)-diNAcBac-PP-undecaprenol alpha-1,4-N-acetyl-D-galactosaminyltransferase